MGHTIKNKLDIKTASAIDRAVRHALEEKLEAAENEIVEKVMYKLDHKNPVAACVQRGIFNPLGGP